MPGYLAGVGEIGVKDCYDKRYSCDWTQTDLQIYSRAFTPENLDAWDNTLFAEGVDMRLMDSLTALRGVSPAAKLCLLALQDLH